MSIIKSHIVIYFVLLIAIVALSIVVWDIKKDMAKIQKEFEHIEEEAHEAIAASKRMEAQAKLSESSQNKKSVKPKAIIEKTEYDFGVIKKSDGIVKTDFAILNAGLGDLLIGDVTTSCSCTSAIIDKKRVIDTERAILTVNFDPNVHEEPTGRFSRSIFVPLNDPDLKEMEFKIFVEIKD